MKDYSENASAPDYTEVDDAAILDLEREMFLASFEVVPHSAIASSMRSKLASPMLSHRPLGSDLARVALLDELQQASAVGVLRDVEELLALMARVLEWADRAGVTTRLKG